MDLAQLNTTHLLALAAALGWASGMRLYLAVFATGLAGFMGWVTLPSGLHVLQHPLALGAAGLMLGVEFFADKIPGLDTLWDMVHTVIRVPAGAALAFAAMGADGPTSAWLAALLGGGLAATAHVAKASTRAAVNSSPEPFSNIGLSLLGDAAVPGLLWLAFEHPLMALVVVGVAALVALVLTALLLRFVRGWWRRLAQRLRPSEPADLSRLEPLTPAIRPPGATPGSPPIAPHSLR